MKNLWKQPLQNATPQKLLSKSFSETFIRTAFLCHIFKNFFHFLNSLSHKKDHFRIYKLIMVSQTCKTFRNLDTVTHRCSVKEVLWKISQNLQESCCYFPVNFTKVFRPDQFIVKLLWTAASENRENLYIYIYIYIYIIRQWTFHESISYDNERCMRVLLQ